MSNIVSRFVSFDERFSTPQSGVFVEVIAGRILIKQTNYIFFVAKPNFSGLSDFASTYQEHLGYAKKYQVWIDSLLKAKASKDTLG